MVGLPISSSLTRLLCSALVARKVFEELVAPLAGVHPADEDDVVILGGEARLPGENIGRRGRHLRQPSRVDAVAEHLAGDILILEQPVDQAALLDRIVDERAR